MAHCIAVLIGTRPEAIKMAPVIAALRDDPLLEPYVINAGQHREMIAQVVELFGIQVDADLAAMEPSQTLAGLTSRLVDRIDQALAAAQPEMVLVQGDTTTVLCAALASFYRRIPIGHVEAGLRTGTIDSPFPEEANRRLTSPLVALHFAPTETSRQALLAERIPDESIFVTGNTVIDALLAEVRRQQDAEVRGSLHSQFEQVIGSDWNARPFILVTGHRRENFGSGFESICAALAELATRRPDVLIVYPVHLNPQVKEVVHARLGNLPNVRLIPPQPYAQFVALATACKLILTDSGGVQEEAPSLGKPVLVMRESTERPEGVAAGAVRLVGPHADRIVTETLRLLDDEAAYGAMAQVANPYGDGEAAGRIVAAIRQYLSGR
ncbi:non-hydrolyzing UDP-N-acetylglucosamine 2-epimerase [Lacipirellula parvula]|uniref:UDP-N-acetylglucosamine 2-epimerase (non-hydrolyzing) n=1 Tax=Lacipirellula parvula TaxID=2650471 RepID=A0A5K7X698_9BACT|nr:UDP-N-acetylglucosamine 2-epimerase (non-hydrolyzing) [Lacipirellula parvula]BBO31367.1 UDP-N-acetylglucosamine 2-epimerase [Lacipirellula parvula]